MSHCTSFPIHYADKRTLYRALRNLGWNPENQVWSEFESEINKKLNIGGRAIGKLLTAYIDNINIYFIETNEGLNLNTESSRLTVEEKSKMDKKLIRLLNKEYVKVAVNQLVAEINMAGESVDVHIEEKKHSLRFILSIADSSRKLTISLGKNGQIEESVEGVAGKSCMDLTQGIESRLFTGTMIERTWTHEYDAVIEDQVVQVLKLSN